MYHDLTAIYISLQKLTLKAFNNIYYNIYKQNTHGILSQSISTIIIGLFWEDLKKLAKTWTLPPTHFQTYFTFRKKSLISLLVFKRCLKNNFVLSWQCYKNGLKSINTTSYYYFHVLSNRYKTWHYIFAIIIIFNFFWLSDLFCRRRSENQLTTSPSLFYFWKPLLTLMWHCLITVRHAHISQSCQPLRIVRKNYGIWPISQSYGRRTKILRV